MEVANDGEGHWTWWKERLVLFCSQYEYNHDGGDQTNE